jgi:hypothetical protein
MDRRDSVEDEAEAAPMSGHFIRITRYYDFLRAKVERIPTLRFGGGEGDNVAPMAERAGPHMTHATDPDNAHFLATPGSGEGVNRS